MPEVKIRVAIKTLKRTTLPLINEEISFIATCQHMNIVEYVGHYSDPFGVHIVTEFMSGGSLEELIQDKSKACANFDVINFNYEIL